MSNDIVEVTYVDGIDVEDMNDGAIFNRIAKLNDELDSLASTGVTGPAMNAAVANVKGKIEALTAIVNGRYVDIDTGEVAE